MRDYYDDCLAPDHFVRIAYDVPGNFVAFDNILNMRIPWDDITIGEGEDCLSERTADLLKKLLEPDPTKRLNVIEIKKHIFFEGFYLTILI